MKKIQILKVELITGGDLCSGNAAAFAAGFCALGGLLNPFVGIGCSGLGLYCALR